MRSYGSPGDRKVGGRWLPLAVVVLVVGLGLSAARADDLQVPNLVPLRPYQIHFGLEDHALPSDPEPQRAIRFSISTANRGAYSLELVGEMSAAGIAGGGTRGVSQCVWWVSRACAHRMPVGNFVWHDDHRHWHYEDYAVYELRRAPGGVPDMSPSGLVAPGQKASFCLLDGWRENNPPGHDPLASVPLYGGCREHVQGISPGWADEYGYLLAGQQIPVPASGIADGVYAVVVTVNPLGRLFESSTGDNTAHRLIEVSAGGTMLRELS